MEKVYACIDLKSFYASVECVERGLNPLTTNLVVADNSRTEKTICLAVSPSLKSYGIPGRARLFEVVQKVKEINNDRKLKNNNKLFNFSYDNEKLIQNKNLRLDYIVATPRMNLYIKYSTKVYNVYLKYLSKDDIYVYSIDEVFCDITNYLKYYKLTPKQLVTKILKDVYETVGITATAGIGTNMYLAKVAMDIVSKHINANEDMVRIAELDEMNYRKMLWNHRPLTDFWRVGKGYSKKLEENNMFTMGDICRCSIYNEEILYKLFGVNAELLIDHAWGYEPCTISDVKSYKPECNSLSSGQVLQCPYDYKKTRLIVKEMTDLLVLQIVSKKLITDSIVLTIGYDISNLASEFDRNNYKGDVIIDYYGRSVPKHSHGTKRLETHTSSTKIIMKNILELFDNIINKNLLVRRINISFNNLLDEECSNNKKTEQYNIFTDYEVLEKESKKEDEKKKLENKINNVVLDIKSKFGKNSILKAMNLEEGGTTISRNNQVGGHRA